MQVEYKTEKGTLLFIKLSDYVISLTEIIKKSLWYRHDVGFSYINLPSEGFQLIGLTGEVTKEQAKMIVKSLGRGDCFKNYADKLGNTFSNALDSFKSLMQHLQVYEVNPFNPHKSNMELIQYYNKIDRVGKWIVLFKPNE